MLLSLIGIKLFFQLYLRRLGSFSDLKPTREPDCESESDSADTEVFRFLECETLLKIQSLAS